MATHRENRWVQSEGPAHCFEHTLSSLQQASGYFFSLRYELSCSSSRNNLVHLTQLTEVTLMVPPVVCLTLYSLYHLHTD